MKRKLFLIFAATISASLLLGSAASAKSKLLRLDTVVMDDHRDVTTQEVIQRVINEAAPFKNNPSLSGLSVGTVTEASEMPTIGSSASPTSSLHALIQKYNR